MSGLLLEGGRDVTCFRGFFHQSRIVPVGNTSAPRTPTIFHYDRGSGCAATSMSTASGAGMSPIEEHLVELVTQELAAGGVLGTRTIVLSSDAENWRFRIQAENREFEIGFNHRDLMWCRETTPGSERHMVSNDQPPVPTSAAARATAIRLVVCAINHPRFPPRDPPVI